MQRSVRAAGGVMLAAVALPLCALAASPESTVHSVEVQATLHGVASVRTLAASAENRAMLANAKPMEMLPHRYPDGSLSGPRARSLPTASIWSPPAAPPRRLPPPD